MEAIVLHHYPRRDHVGDDGRLRQVSLHRRHRHHEYVPTSPYVAFLRCRYCRVTNLSRKALVEAIAKSFDPPAVYMYQWSQYYVPCNSIPPQLAVIIEEVRFWVNPADLIFQQAVDPMTGYCALGITTGDDGPYILGDVFLQSVVAVFDVGGGQMRFYSRR
jgi:hypothetical protein